MKRNEVQVLQHSLPGYTLGEFVKVYWKMILKLLRVLSQMEG